MIIIHRFTIFIPSDDYSAYSILKFTVFNVK